MSVRRLSNSTISTQGRGKSSTFIAGYSPAVDEMDLLETVTLASASSQITFSSIPQTYTGIQVRMRVRNTQNATGLQHVRVRFNNDSGTNYSNHGLRGERTASFSNEVSTSNLLAFSCSPRSQTTSGVVGCLIGEVLNYSDTTRNKTFWCLSGTPIAVSTGSGLWINNSAITRLDLLPEQDQFAALTTASLYGVR